jgi:hypothetical protein
MFFLTILPYPSHSRKVRAAAALHTGTIVEADIVLSMLSLAECSSAPLASLALLRTPPNRKNQVDINVTKQGSVTGRAELGSGRGTRKRSTRDEKLNVAVTRNHCKPGWNAKNLTSSALPASEAAAA